MHIAKRRGERIAKRRGERRCEIAVCRAGLKDNHVEDVVGDPDGPVPDVLLYQQPDAQSAGERPTTSCQLRRKPVISGQKEYITSG